MMKTSHELGFEKGQRQLLRRMIERQFGPLPVHLAAIFEAMPHESIEAVADRFKSAQSVADLRLDEVPVPAN